ncbi:MAG: FxDxF family PEP-CTERM protein [Sterolibacteriaceae bacterium]|uniref:FxDxF family PEP-CTERM protein n=1 Tax=Candidatus Methylophosphatis roskildensis TaxID=2899263 RepID=A0A9D7HM63_9PROT|nr:FxDxF family PEP-CTERM protein [Candidatus Methylophosphatis roskildensis]
MKQILSRWLLPVVLVFGLVGTAAAHGDSSDDGFTKTFTKTFTKFFLDDAGQTFGKMFDFKIGGVSMDDAGQTFGKMCDFKIGGVSNLITLKVASFDLSNLAISIFDKKSDLSVYQTTFADKLNETFALSPGKYSLFFTGTVSSNLAGYAGAMSAAPVPEPAEWMMILAGVAMMGVVVSRRRNNG